MAEDETSLGKLPPRYRYIFNPFDDLRLSKCPRCELKTHLRKFALFIVVEGFGPLALGKTCRFCTPCDLIMVHQDELEHELVIALEPQNPDVIGNDYMVFGTVDKRLWRKGLEGKSPEFDQILDHTADFAEVLDLHYDPGGWRPA